MVHKLMVGISQVKNKYTERHFSPMGLFAYIDYNEASVLN